MMKKFRLISLLLVLLLASLLLCSRKGDAENTGNKSYPTKTLNVYNWGEYISDEDDPECGLFDVIAGFEEYFNNNLADKYQCYIKVNYSTYATNEDMYAKLTNSAVAYDIVIPSDYMIQKMINHVDENGNPDSLLIKLDYSKLTNYGNINEEFKNLYYDSKNEYPFRYIIQGWPLQ